MTLPTTNDVTLRTSDTAAEMWDLVDAGNPAEARQTYPSGWLWLTDEESIRTLLVSFVGADPDERHGFDDLASRSGLGDEAVERAVDALISLGVLVADEGTYRVNEYSIVRDATEKLSAAVEETGAPDDESGIEYLARYESVRLMIDALLGTDPERALDQDTIHRLTGVSRKRVWHHVEKLVTLGVLAESGDEYVIVSDSPVLRLVQSLDAAVVGAVLSSSHP